MRALSPRRRLEALEGQLSPCAVVLRWLAEAKAHGSMSAYADALATGPGTLDPIERFLYLLEPAINRLAPGQSGPDVERARHRAARPAIFRYFLILRLNAEASERGPLLAARAVANSYHLSALIAGGSGVDGFGDEDPEEHSDWPAWQDTNEGLLTELYAAGFARTTLEALYLDRTVSLLPDVEHDWATARELTELTMRARLAARAPSSGDPLTEFRQGALERIITTALEQAIGLVETTLARITAEVSELAEFARS